jgi:hypothetical protein
MLGRNFKKAPQHTKAMAVNTLIRPKEEYSSAVWDPYGSQTAELYSTFGLIKVLTAIALVCCGAFLKFLPSMPWA